VRFDVHGLWRSVVPGNSPPGVDPESLNPRADIFVFFLGELEESYVRRWIDSQLIGVGLSTVRQTKLSQHARLSVKLTEQLWNHVVRYFRISVPRSNTRLPVSFSCRYFE